MFKDKHGSSQTLILTMPSQVNYYPLLFCSLKFSSLPAYIVYKSITNSLSIKKVKAAPGCAGAAF